MWDSWKDLLTRNPSGRFSDVLLKGGLRHLLLALDYLHTECKLVHTDIKADNILHAIADPDILHSFVKDEMTTPSARKLVDGTPVYVSRRFGLPNDWGRIILSDFGTAVPGDVPRTDDAQPDVYRCPEVMIQAPWSYPADIRNVGAMIWDVFECGHLFHGRDPAPEKGYYTTRAHWAEVVGLLGLPPVDFLQRGVRSKEFFDANGESLCFGGLVSRVMLMMVARRQMDCSCTDSRGEQLGNGREVSLGEEQGHVSGFCGRDVDVEA